MKNMKNINILLIVAITAVAEVVALCLILMAKPIVIHDKPVYEICPSAPVEFKNLFTNEKNDIQR